MVVALCGVAITASAAHAGAGRLAPPKWLLRADAALLIRAFGDARPLRIHYLAYPRKIAVVFEFSHPVTCGLCDDAGGRPPLRARVVRVSFYRATHALTGTVQLCEVEDGQPPKSRCLHR
jgi:hypothetical protein